MLDLWTLRVLAAVGEEGSFSGAAADLRLTQPTVSRQIASLERRLGVTLFHRLPRGVRPTRAGEVAIGQAVGILARVSTMETQLRAFTELDSGRVRVTAFPSANTSLVPGVIARFTDRYPGVEVNLVDVPSARAVDAVRAGRVDIALVTDWDHPATDDGVERVPLVDDGFLVALPGDHPLVRRDPLRLKDLRDQRWIEGAHPDCLGPLDGLGSFIGGPPRIGHVCDDWNGKQALVAAGLGIMIFPVLALPSARPDLILRRTTPALPPRRIYLAMLEVRHRPPAVTEIAAMFRTAVRATGQGRVTGSPSPSSANRRSA